MNKLFVSAVAGMAALLGATSCSDDNSAPVAKGVEKEVTLTVAAPESFRSRANALYGDGATNDLTLTYAIYRSDGSIQHASTKPESPVAEQTSPGKWTLKVRLMSEDTYNVVFWADQFGEDEANPYAIDLEATTLTVDYKKSLAYENLVSDRSDAYILYTAFVADQQNTFTMKRPFAQVNVGSNEYEIKNTAGYYHDVPTNVSLAYSESAISGSLPNVFNYKTGKVYGAGGDITPERGIDQVASDFDDLKYDFPVNKGAQYMYMAYILAPQTPDGWADANANADRLTLNLSLGMAPFNGERRALIRVKNLKNAFLANNRIIIGPACLDLGNGGGENPDPDPDPENPNPDPIPDLPGFIEDNYVLNVIYDPGFAGEYKHNCD